MRQHTSLGLITGLLVFICGCAGSPRVEPSWPIPRLAEALAANTDVWGDAAIKRPGGPTYEFFRDRLPPLRYVTASFVHYPIVLSAPASPVKVRLVSNGSTINALGRTNNWINETGVPATVHVGSALE